MDEYNCESVGCKNPSPYHVHCWACPELSFGDIWARFEGEERGGFAALCRKHYSDAWFGETLKHFQSLREGMVI